MVDKLFGFNLLHDQLLDHWNCRIGGILGFHEDRGYGTTPIERLFMAALHGHLLCCEQEWFHRFVPLAIDRFDAIKNDPELDRHALFITPQAQLDGWRVDFLIRVFADWARNPNGGPPGWNSLIVECDGHDFHERTKEQAAKDRNRDREAQLSGTEVFRFTGSELWRDPLGCADQVISWANRRV